MQEMLLGRHVMDGWMRSKQQMSMSTWLVFSVARTVHPCQHECANRECLNPVIDQQCMVCQMNEGPSHVSCGSCWMVIKLVYLLVVATVWAADWHLSVKKQLRALSGVCVIS
jgi:hypothetical protein